MRIWGGKASHLGCLIAVQRLRLIRDLCTVYRLRSGFGNASRKPLTNKYYRW